MINYLKMAHFELKIFSFFCNYKHVKKHMCWLKLFKKQEKNCAEISRSGKKMAEIFRSLFLLLNLAFSSKYILFKRVMSVAKKQEKYSKNIHHIRSQIYT